MSKRNYSVNYECHVSDRNCRPSQRLVIGQSLEDAFHFAAGLEAEAWLDGDRDGTAAHVVVLRMEK